MAGEAQFTYRSGTQVDSHRTGAISQLAARQHGVVSRGQLLDAGVTERMIYRRLRGGQLLRLHPGVYAVGHAQLRPEGRWLAAVLAVGPDAALSHRSAAALHGIRDSEGAGDVTTIRRATVRGLVIHRTTALDAQDVAIRRGVRVTSVERTLVDLAETLTADRIAKLLRETDRLGRLNAPALHTALDRTSGRKGSGRRAVRAALDAHQRLATSLTLSELEDRFIALLDAGNLPRPLTNHKIDGLRVDAAWPQQWLVAELDGWASHYDRAAFQEDRSRDVRLARAGWTVVRFTHADVVARPAWVAETVRELLERTAPSAPRATMSDPCRSPS